MKTISTLLCVSASIWLLSTLPAFSQVDVCPVRCPDFAPNYSPKTLMCQEPPIEPLLQDILSLPASVSKFFWYVFDQFKDEMASAWKDRKSGQPACNKSASRFPEYPADNTNRDKCAQQYQQWNAWLEGSDYSSTRKGIQFTAWCLGTFGVGVGTGDFDEIRWQNKLANSGVLDQGR